MGTAALVFGIISLINAVFGGFAGLVGFNLLSVRFYALLTYFVYTFIALITAIVAIILGAIAKKDPNQKGAKAGLIMGIIALSYGIIATVTILACISQHLKL